jgi:hypothetical protein
MLGKDGSIKHHFCISWGQNTVFCPLFFCLKLSFNTSGIGQLLEKLLKQGLTEAEDFAKYLIAFPLPSTDNQREKRNMSTRVRQRRAGN